MSRKGKVEIWTLVLGFGLVFLLGLSEVSFAARTIERVSVATDGTEANNSSERPSISSDGRYVAFQSLTTNLVAGDNNDAQDIFVYDRDTDTIERVSVDDDGNEGNSSSSYPSISSDGRYVAFYSPATNLVAGDTNTKYDIFVRDRDTDEDGIFDEPGAVSTERVSIATDGTEGDNNSYYPSISSDGRYVAFHSFATNLVAGDTNGKGDIFVYDRNQDAIERVSIATDGTEGDNNSYYPSISSDGRYIAFQSLTTNLVANDTNTKYDIFVRDRDTDEDGIFDEPGAVSTERVSVATDGTEGDGDSKRASINSDGHYIAFYSYTANLVAGDTNGVSDIFVYDRTLNTIERVSIDDDGNEGSAGSYHPSISSDGCYVAFYSRAADLVAEDTNGVSDVFIYDRTTDIIERVSADDSGNEGNAGSSFPSIDSNGRYVAFESVATNLVAGDTNGKRDIFVRDRDTDEDGLLDVWEMNYFGDLSHGPDEDYDSDDLTNLQEYNANTDPTDSDSEDDGMPDGWEVSYGLDPLEDDASGDLDSDGFTNLQEYKSSTNPNDSGSTPTRPYVVSWYCQPYPDQGIDETSLRVPVDTSVVVRAKSDVGIDVSTASIIIKDAATSTEMGGSLLVKAVDPSDTEFKDCWLTYISASLFEYEQEIEVTVNVKDTNTVPMETYTYRFKTETEEQHQIAEENSPASTEYPDTPEVGKITIEANPGTEVEGAKIIYDSTEPVTPHFGPTDEIPELNVSDTDAIGIPVNLQPATVFENPVTIFIPCPDVSDLSVVSIYYYNPSLGWLEASDESGWLVADSRVEHLETTPPTIEIQVYHFSGTQAGKASTPAQETSSEGADRCFIATAAYGTPMAKEVKSLCKFRDDVLLKDPLGREFVKFYYTTSPPIADFIRNRPGLKAMVRKVLKPLVEVSKEITK